MKVGRDGSGPGVNCERDGNAEGLVEDAITVEEVLGAVDSGGQVSDAGAHEALGVVEQFGDEGADAIGAVSRGQLTDAPLAQAAGANLRGEVALALGRRADVGEDQVEQLALEFPPAHDADGRDANALLEDVFGRAHGAGVAASDVGVVGAVGEKEGRGRVVIKKDRQDHGDVWQVGAAGPGVVEHGDVARLEAEGADGGLHAHGHGAEVDGHVIAHGDDAALAVKQGAGVVAALLDVGAEGGTAQDRTHLFGDGADGGGEDGEGDRVFGAHGRASVSTVRTRLEKASTASDAPGGSTVAAVYSVMSAGPGKLSPGRRASRR